jgi:hypothetical protein
MPNTSIPLIFRIRDAILVRALFGSASCLRWPDLLSPGITELLWLTVAAQSVTLLALTAAVLTHRFENGEDQVSVYSASAK